MGTTFVGLEDNGFWMRDSILELWLRLLALHVEDPTESGTVATSIRDGWLLASRGFFPGCVPHRLQEAVATAEGSRLARAAIHSLLEALGRAPPVIQPQVLNLMGMEGTWTSDVETGELIEVGKAFLDLLEGKFKGTAAETSFIPRLAKTRDDT